MLHQTHNTARTGQLVLPLGIPSGPPLWRPIHYLGSKLRLAKSIHRYVTELDPTAGTVCDLFAGSGTVARALSQDRKVVAADIQEYSRVLCSALLQPAILGDALVQRLLQDAASAYALVESCLAPVLDLEQRAFQMAAAQPDLLCALTERGSLLTPQSGTDDVSKATREAKSRIDKQSIQLTATRYFGGAYFSYGQALYLDCMLHAIDQQTADIRDTALAALLSTASTIVNSVGKQFAQPMRPRRKDGTVKTHLIQQMCRDRRLDTAVVFFDWLSRYRQLPQTRGHLVIRGDFRDVLRELDDVSVVYADPPYTRDHYSRFYHVLETLCLRDSPTVSTTSLTGEGKASRGVYREHRHQSPFCIKSQAAKAFDELFRGCRKLDASVLVSYSPYMKDGHPRLMTVDAVKKIAADHYRHVEVKSARPLTHSKLNKSELHLDASTNAEVFILCRS